MPGYKGHLIGGFIAFFGVVLLLSPFVPILWKTAVLGLFFTCIGALFPDVDTKSKGQKLFYSLLCVLIVPLIIQRLYFMLIGLAGIGILPLLVRHRGIFHNIWFIALLTIIFALGFSTILPGAVIEIVSNAVFFFLGALSHLILDFGLMRAFKMR